MQGSFVLWVGALVQNSRFHGRGGMNCVMHEGEVAQVANPKVLLTSPVNEYVAQLIDTPRRHSDFIESLLHGSMAGGEP